MVTAQFILTITGLWRWRGLPWDPGGPISPGYGLQEVYIKCTCHASGRDRQDQIWCHSKTRSL